MFSTLICQWYTENALHILKQMYIAYVPTWSIYIVKHGSNYTPVHAYTGMFINNVNSVSGKEMHYTIESECWYIRVYIKQVFCWCGRWSALVLILSRMFLLFVLNRDWNLIAFGRVLYHLGITSFLFTVKNGQMNK